MPAGLTSPVHLFVIIVVALVVLGPEKLPQALRQVGRTMGEVRRWSDAMSGELREVLSLDVGDQTPPTPSLTPPSSRRNGNTVPAPPVPSLAALPSAPPDVVRVDSAHHPALQEGGEWH